MSQLQVDFCVDVEAFLNFFFFNLTPMCNVDRP